MKTFREVVFSNLNSALENGYDQRCDLPEHVAADLQAYAQDCEGAAAAYLLPHIIEWQREQRK